MTQESIIKNLSSQFQFNNSVENYINYHKHCISTPSNYTLLNKDIQYPTPKRIDFQETKSKSKPKQSLKQAKIKAKINNLRKAQSKRQDIL